MPPYLCRWPRVPIPRACHAGCNFGRPRGCDQQPWAAGIAVAGRRICVGVGGYPYRKGVARRSRGGPSLRHDIPRGWWRLHRHGSAHRADVWAPGTKWRARVSDARPAAAGSASDTRSKGPEGVAAPAAMGAGCAGHTGLGEACVTPTLMPFPPPGGVVCNFVSRPTFSPGVIAFPISAHIAA